MNNKHPLLRNNYIPRIICCCWTIIVTTSVHWPNLLQPEVLWLYPVAATWPHLALYLGKRAESPKRQELINMKLDALIMGLIFACSPELLYAGMLLTIISVNGILIGAIPLLLLECSIFFAAFLFGRIFIDVPFSADASLATTIAVVLFYLVYFNSFGFMGFALTRNLIQLNKEIRELSIRDGLTGCFNRTYLNDYLKTDLRRCQRLEHPLTLIFADLDYFKRINDDYGHNTGDQVLKHFVRIAGHCIRDDTDWIARFGGEEFIIVLVNADIKNGEKIAERIRHKLANTPILVGDKKIVTTASFGVSSTSTAPHSVQTEALLTEADANLYRAKSTGRNKVEVSNAA